MSHRPTSTPDSPPAGPSSQKLAFGVEPARSRYRLRLARYQGLAEAIAEHIRAAPAERQFQLLDVGVGDGRSLRYLEAEGLADRVEFHGIDLSPRRLAGLYRPERWRLVQGNVEQGLPYAAGRFDVLICEQVLEHLNNPRAVLLEMARVMKPGGLLIAGVPIFPPGAHWIRSTLIPRIDRWLNRERGHVQAFSKGSFVRLVRQTGVFDLFAARGFRIVSGGVLGGLEDYRWWWRLNRRLGRALPSLCTEIQILAHRR